MSIIIIVILSLFFYADIVLMIRQNKGAFSEAFRIPRSFYFVYISLFLIGTFFFQHQAKFYILLFSFLLPVYLLKRMRYRKLFSRSDFSANIRVDESLMAFDALGVLFIWLFIMNLLMAFLSGILFLLKAPHSSLGEAAGVTIGSSLIFLFLVLRYVKEYPQLSLFKVFGLVSNKQSMFRLVILPAVCGFAVAAVTSCVIFFRQYEPVTPMDEMIETTRSYDALVLFVFSAVIFAPLFEELIFRGFFFYFLKRFKGQAFAISVIALMFALLHFDQYWGDGVAIMMVTFLGFALTFFRAWTGTSWSSIVMHYTFNGSMMVLPMILLVLFNPSFFQYNMNFHKLGSEQKEHLLYQSINAQPDFAESYNELAWLFAEEDRNLDEALHLINEALNRSPHRFAYLDTKAEVLYKLKKFPEAIEIAEYLVKRYPSNEYASEQLRKFQNALKENKE